MMNNYNNPVKGSSMMQKLQNSKGYVELPEFPPVHQKLTSVMKLRPER